MTTIIFTLLIFFELIYYIIIIDIILSWLILFKIRFRPKFISNILDPLYSFIKKTIPTTFWAFDFTPIIVIVFLLFIRWLLLYLFPEVQTQILNLIN